jgi:hypothetical protein
LENKLEDVYSIVQFLDPRHAGTPLWRFAAEHFMLSPRQERQDFGIPQPRPALHDTAGDRWLSVGKKEDVLDDLPDESGQQLLPAIFMKNSVKIHEGYRQSLLASLLNKKYS